jgi:three-Cys-motif partner protein
MRVSTPKQQFGGEWTTEKLERVRKYLVAYATIMNALRKKTRGFRFAYIDAFAGTGYNTTKQRDDEFMPFFEGVRTADSQRFLDGSARIALGVDPQFDRYIFIERSPARFKELAKLADEFPSLRDRIQCVNADATNYLDDLCGNKNWINHRAVLFLDPFGMQVTWKTITAIAKTEAVDLWLLFPLGSGANRLLKRDGEIPDSWRTRLDATFGAKNWFDAFYQKVEQYDLLSGQPTSQVRKVADFDSISRYFLKRLKTVFPHVAMNPLPLFNKANCPLYLLCFAAGNPGSGGKVAVKIAEDILKP